MLALSALLLLADAQAEPWTRLPPPGAERASMLLCDGQGPCAEDAAWIAGQGLVAGEPLVLVDLLLELDAGGWLGGVDRRGAFEQAMADARAEAAAKRWPAVEHAAARAEEALGDWPGTVEPQALFDLWYLQGAARVHARRDRGHEQSFRQAAAMLQGPPESFPTDDTEARNAFVDEQRKLAMAGTGTLLLGMVPPGTRIWVDGRLLPPDSIERPLPPARHRVTALGPDSIHTWQAWVPVLGERDSRVVIELPASSSAAWVSEQLEAAFTTLQAPAELRALLQGWCLRHRVAELRLLQVVQPRLASGGGSVQVGPAPATRPAAAEGEEVDHGDGVPTTYEDQLEADHIARAEAHASEAERRLRVAFFDPLTGHLHADGLTPAALLEQPARHLRLDLRLGYLRLLDRHHAALDLGVAVALGPLWARGTLGLARADQEYRYYPDWNDRQIYRAAAGFQWLPLEGALSPLLGAELEAWIPVTLGGRALAGIEGRLGAGWALEAALQADLTGEGLGWGAGAGLSRGF